MNDKYPPDFLKLLHSIKAKRPKTVIKHILKYGKITTEDLKEMYGYHHPPRAIRDVREQGIPIITFRVISNDGRKIAAYKFGNPSEIRSTQLSGRTSFTKKLKAKLINKYGSRCNIYLHNFPERQLQIDHRIPFEISGDKNKLSNNLEKYMLLSASANRAKSWSCEHCKNWKIKKTENCDTCYWAYPEKYLHIAMQNVRRLDILWSEEEITAYEKLKKEAERLKYTPPEYVKNLLHLHLKNTTGK